MFAVGGFGPAMLAVTLFSLVFNILVLAMPIYTLQLFDRVLGSRSVDTLLLLSMAVFIALILQVIIDGVRMRILQRMANRVESFFSVAVLQASLLRSARSGQVTAQPMRDLVDVKQALASPGVLALFDAPWVPLFLLATFILHPYIGYLTLIGMALLFLLAIIHAWYVARTSERLNTTAISAFEDMQDYAENADSLVSMGMRDAVSLSWQKNARELGYKSAVMSEGSAVVQSISKFIRMLLQVSVMGLGCYLVLQLQMSAGAMIAASILMARALAPAEQAIGSWRAITTGRQALERLSDLLAEDDLNRPAVPVTNPRGPLQLDRLAFAADGMSRPILHPTNLKLEEGSVVGIIGPSGSGKSTLARLMVGVLAPTSGYVTLGGIDVTRRSAYDLGPAIGYLPQDARLFHGTVRENVARLQDADPEEIRTSAAMAGVEALIDALPDGFDTKIGRNGVQLSGGQQQRIGLARAMFGTPRLLVLDEPDANLDREGLAELCRAVLNMKEAGSIVVVISHRPEILQVVDRLVVIKEGRIWADNIPEVVLRTLNENPAIAAPYEAPKVVKDPVPLLASKEADNTVAFKSGREDTQDGGDASGAPVISGVDVNQPIPISNWPEDVLHLWRSAVSNRRLPVDADARRSMAIALGWWLSYSVRNDKPLSADVAASDVENAVDEYFEKVSPHDSDPSLVTLLGLFTALGFEAPAATFSKEMKKPDTQSQDRALS